MSTTSSRPLRLCVAGAVALSAAALITVVKTLLSSGGSDGSSHDPPMRVERALKSVHRPMQKAPTKPTKQVQVEVVLAHYNEDIAWIDERKQMTLGRPSNDNARYTIYSKSPSPPPSATVLPNVGRESHTYLHHIVNNYGSLADWTVFTQAALPSFGYMVDGDTNESGHLSSGVTWDNYLEPFPNGQDWYMVQTVASSYPHSWHTERMDFLFQDLSSSGGTCPADDEDGWEMWWYDKDHPVDVLLSKAQPEALGPVEFYNKFIVADSNKPYYNAIILNYAQGARFAVSKERIHLRPLEYYQDLLKEVSKSDYPIEGYYMEAMWYDVFHPENLQAEFGPACGTGIGLPTLPEDDAVSLYIMHQDAIRRRALSRRKYSRLESSPYRYKNPSCGSKNKETCGDGETVPGGCTWCDYQHKCVKNGKCINPPKNCAQIKEEAQCDASSLGCEWESPKGPKVNNLKGGGVNSKVRGTCKKQDNPSTSTAEGTASASGTILDEGETEKRIRTHNQKPNKPNKL